MSIRVERNPFDAIGIRRQASMCVRPQSSIQAEATARRLAMAANHRQPLSTRNLMKRKTPKGASALKKSCSVVDMACRHNTDVTARRSNHANVEPFASFDAFDESKQFGPFEFEEFIFNDPFSSYDESNPRSAQHRKVGANAPRRIGKVRDEKQDYRRLPCHAAKSGSPSLEAWLDNDISLDELWKMPDSRTRERAVFRSRHDCGRGEREKVRRPTTASDAHQASATRTLRGSLGRCRSHRVHTSHGL
jgi:hypothetical protein